MTSILRKNFILICILLLVIVGIGLRFYKLDQIPPGISWDEAANGYNAWTIINYGRDEFGKDFPVYFTSFRDDKQPVHIYLTAPFVFLFGLNEFGTRFPSALLGVLNILLIFLVGREMYNKWVGLGAAFSLTFSPYALQFSRFNHELNFSIFFLLLGLYLFYLGLRKNNIWLSISFISFGICLLTYHSPKAVVPPLILILILVYFRKLGQMKKKLILGLGFLSIFIILILFNPALLGGARASQTLISEGQIKETHLYKTTNNQVLGFLNVVFDNYISHYSKKYFLDSGDINGRHSSQAAGIIFTSELPFLIAGLISLCFMRSKANIILLSWLLLAPVPASVVTGAPHAGRAMFMMGSINLLIGLGVYWIFKIIKQWQFKMVILIIFLAFFFYEFYTYLNFYYNDYPKKQATEWQYGMKQIVEFIKGREDVSVVYITEERHQPYIFFLYYLKTPLPEYLRRVNFDTTEKNVVNLVSNFGNYYFGGWDTVESFPNAGVYYVITPSQYGGLRHQKEFEVVKLIKYPDGSDAFYIITKV